MQEVVSLVLQAGKHIPAIFCRIAWRLVCLSCLMNKGKLTNKAFGYAFMVIFCGQCMGLLQEKIQYVIIP